MRIEQITEVNGVLVPLLRLVGHGTQHDTISSILSTSVNSTNHDGVARTRSSSVIFPIILCTSIVLDVAAVHLC